MLNKAAGGRTKMNLGPPPNIHAAALLIILISILVPGLTQAHPHVFIAQKLHVVFDDSGMAGIKVFWQFDDMFSNMIVMDHDLNQNQAFEPAEVQSIKEKAFKYISESDYFFSIKINDKPFKVKWVKDFNARLIYGKLIYEFVIPCHVTAGLKNTSVTVASFDPNYYSAIYYVNDKPFSLKGSDPFETRASISEDPDNPIFHGMVNPWTLFLEFKKIQ